MITSGKCHGKNDIELVKLTLADQDYFLCLMTKYQPPLLRYIRRISGFDASTAEDILQEVFVKVYQNLNDFDQDLKFSSWIYRITHNQVITHYRRLKARPQHINFNLDDDLIDHIASDLDIEHQVDNQLNQEIILKILSQLDLKYREVLILRFFEDKNYQEISDILKKPSGTIATLISRAKKAFKQELEKQDIKI